MVFVNKNVSHASMAKLGEQRIALRPNFPCGFKVLLSVEREFSAPNLRFLYAERAFAAVAIHLCDGGGVIEVGFLRSAGFGMAKAQGKRHSRRVWGEVFPRMVFLCLCVIVLCASQDSPCDDFPRMRNYSTLLFSCIE